MRLLKGQAMTISKALVFDIKRFAVHDGDGIRTTVFFKGCPLRCLWCQNPEGLPPHRQVIYLENRCIHCKICACVSNEKELIYHHRPYFSKEYEGSYDHVVHACPTGAISYDSQYYTVEDLFKEILKDEVFFKQGGGVTFSGGEPFMQGSFLIDILKLCHEHHIHTAIETSFYTSLELIQEALNYLDLIYVDMKVFDDKKHRELTGQSNKIIKQNIEYLLTSHHKHKVIFRTPLIPGQTDSDENIYDIAQFIYNLYPYAYYELLNYNELAPTKYNYIDENYPLSKNLVKLSLNQMNHLYKIIESTGLKNIIKEGE